MSLFSRAYVPGNVNIEDSYRPGIYTKKTTTSLVAQYAEIKANDFLWGWQVVLDWGDLETVSGGVSSWHFDTILQPYIDAISDFATCGTDKKLMLAVSWKEFNEPTVQMSKLLPNDLAASTGTHDPGGALEHTKYAYAYRSMNDAGTALQGVYNMKLWDPVLLERLRIFIAKLAQYCDSNPRITMVLTLETALASSLAVDEGPAASIYNAYNGQIQVARYLRRYFQHTSMCFGFNFYRAQANRIVGLAPTENWGIGGPNSNEADGLNLDYADNTNPLDLIAVAYPANKGALLVGKNLDGLAIKKIEIQGDDFDNTHGQKTAETGAVTWPSPAHVYGTRVRDYLKCTHTVILRTNGWIDSNMDAASLAKGNSSMLTWLQGQSSVTADSTGAGGLVSARPQYGMPVLPVLY